MHQQAFLQAACERADGLTSSSRWGWWFGSFKGRGREPLCLVLLGHFTKQVYKGAKDQAMLWLASLLGRND